MLNHFRVPEEFEKSFIRYDVEGLAVSGEKLNWCIEEVHNWLALKLTSGVCSDVLALQLALSCCRIELPFGSEKFLIDLHAVLDQIGRLENAPTNRHAPTKTSSKFKRKPLKGLWHQHWFQAYFIYRNLADENRKFGKLLVENRFKSDASNITMPHLKPEEITRNLTVHALTIDSFQHRSERTVNNAGSLTGEWIVYARLLDQNFYLSLGSHKEDGEEVFRRCVLTLSQFPELQEIEPFASLL